MGQSRITRQSIGKLFAHSNLSRLTSQTTSAAARHERRELARVSWPASWTATALVSVKTRTLRLSAA